MNATLADLISTTARLRAAGEDVVVATIVATEGSTYRKAGARMLFTRDGRWTGMLGGGSFEAELATQAAEVFRDGVPREVNCDMPSRRDASLGKEWTKDGSTRIFLQRAGPANAYAPLSLIGDAMTAHLNGVLVTICRSTDARVPAGTSLLVTDTPVQSLPPEIMQELVDTARPVREDGQPLLVEHVLPEGELEAFYDPLRLPLALLILGAGPDTLPLARMARLLGWQVTMVDPRAGAEAEQHADRLLRVDAAALAGQVDLTRVDAAVLMSRNFEMDRAYLTVLAASPVPYIGLLGSKRRRERMLEGLDGAAAATVTTRLHGPAGMDLGGDTPEEIALELAAEIQSQHAHRRSEGRRRAAAAKAALERVHAIVLAAGGSRRFGGFKQLLEFRGESLLRRITRLAGERLGERVMVVHGPKPTKCQRELTDFNVQHVVNARWEGGIATSLRAAIHALPGDCEAALVLLCDQPLIDGPQLDVLLGAWAAQPDRIVAASYADTLGVPAVFPRRFFPRLLELTGDRGAKAVIEAHRGEVAAVPMPEAALDIDTQDDYAAVLTQR